MSLQCRSGGCSVLPTSLGYSEPSILGIYRGKHRSHGPFSLSVPTELDYENQNLCNTNLIVPWTTRRSNQSILKEISPGISLEGMMLKLKLQYIGHLMWRTDSGKDSDAEKDWRQEEKGPTEDEMVGWHHQLNGHELSKLWSWWWAERPGVLQSMGSQRVRHDWATELDWKHFAV